MQKDKPSLYDKVYYSRNATEFRDRWKADPGWVIFSTFVASLVAVSLGSTLYIVFMVYPIATISALTFVLLLTLVFFLLLRDSE